MQAERADRESGLVRLRDQEARLEEAVSALKASREATSAHVNQMQMELDALRGRIETARASAQDVERESRSEREALNALQRDRDRLEGEAAALQGRVGQLDRQRQDLETGLAAAQGRRARLLEAKGRLEADRSALWVEFIALQEKRNASICEAAASEARVQDLRQQRHALHGEIEMLKRILGSTGHGQDARA